MNTTNRIDEARPDGAQPRRWSRLLAIGALCLGLVSCGGGGGGGDTAAPEPLGVLRVTVSDTFGAVVAGATVEATDGTSGTTATTDAQGVALLPFRHAFGSASVTVSRQTFVSRTVAATVTASQVTELPVTLDRATAPAGGSLTSRGAPPVVHTAQSMTFEIELVVVDGNSQPITGLTEANFILRPCAPDDGNDRVDCVRGSAASFDAAYTPVTGSPENLVAIDGDADQPYAAALMLDQSNSIYTSDPTGARLYSAKAFLKGLGADDRVLLSAFASGNAAKIADKPLTVYPSFRGATTAPSYFSTLDSLAGLVGGNTPLYSALDALLQNQDFTDPSLPAGIAKAVVIFTDGDATDCATPSNCRTLRQDSIEAAKAAGVRVFTIGLTNSVNFEALGELANGTGGAFLFAENAEQLIPLYGSVGELLSLSLPTYRLTWTVQATSPDVFLSGNALLGRVEVTTDTGTFEVPFIVGIP